MGEPRGKWLMSHIWEIQKHKKQSEYYSQRVATPVNCPKLITMEIWRVISKG